jgi:preprotein translocase subunit SecA
MLERGVQRRVEQALATFDRVEDWDFAYVEQDLLMHYMLQVPAFSAEGPTSVEEAQAVAVAAVHEAFQAKIESLNQVTDENGQGFADRLLSLVTLNVIDEKWKDHLYDLDQLRASIHYRSWGQKDPLVEYKQDAYTMFVDLMHDLANTFTERFLKAQLVFEPAPVGAFEPPPMPEFVREEGARPTRRYNALGILEDVPADELVVDESLEIVDAQFVEEVHDVAGGAEEPGRIVAQGIPQVLGAGSVRSLGEAGAGALPAGWEQTPRNNVCPCGSGKKFKKCHGAHL